MSTAPEWTVQAIKLLVGRRITDAGYVVDDQWGYALRFVLDNETEVFVYGDDEGNQPGALAFEEPDGSQAMLPQLRRYDL